MNFKSALCITLVPCFLVNKKPSGSCVKPANQIRYCQIEKVFSSLVCCLRLRLLKMSWPKAISAKSKSSYSVIIMVSCQKLKNSLWLSTRVNWKYQGQIYALVTYGPKMLTIHWHIAGTKSLYRSISFLDWVCWVFHPFLFLFPKSCFFSMPATVQSQRHFLERGKRRKKILKKCFPHYEPDISLRSSMCLFWFSGGTTYLKENHNDSVLVLSHRGASFR